MKNTLITIGSSLALFTSAAAQPSVDLPDQFAPVIAKLKTGGPHFSVTDVDGDAEAFFDLLQKISYLAIETLDGAEKEKALSTIDAIDYKDFYGDLGFTQVAARGRSVTELPNGLFHNRSFTSYNAKRRGLIQLLGQQTTSWQAPFYAPKGADLVLETTLDTRFLLPLARTYLEKLKKIPNFPADTAEKFETTLAQDIVPGSDISWQMALEQTSIHASIALTLDPDTKWSPTPGVTLPGFNIIGRIAGVTPYWPLIKKTLDSKFPPKETGKLISYILPEELTPFGKIQPHIIYEKETDTLWIDLKSSPFGVVKDPTNRLFADPEFVATMTDIPAKGSSLIYASKELQEELIQLISTNQNFSQSEATVIKTLIDTLATPKTALAIALASEEDGLLYTFNGPIALKNKNQGNSLIWVSTLAGLAAPEIIKRKRMAEELKKAIENRPKTGN